MKIEVAWDPYFYRACRAFELFEPALLAHLATYPDFPSVSEYDSFRQFVSCSEALTYQFREQDSEALRQRGGYDTFISETRTIPTRPGSYHDLLNALIWLHFPNTKQELHRQLSESQQRTQPLPKPTPDRSPFQNAASHFDESGIIVCSTDSDIFQAIRELRWEDLFWNHRERTNQAARFVCFGHGLLDSLRKPFLGITAKALFFDLEPESSAMPGPLLRHYIDCELSTRLGCLLTSPQDLAPLPVLGIPGWHSAQDLSFYKNDRYFRVARLKQPAGPKT